MSEDLINLEVDGQPVQARRGAMLIEVTDASGAYVPRFCYHEKLSIAANCRMCLVDVENAPKPLPACATPVADGMKVFTRSPRAIAAQKATMEFLLINHPLDCPICDQGGECELQDLAMGYGRDVSRYTERKRVAVDENIGPLISTDMTRCILCTRCVRFGQEIAGIQELGTMGRGEYSQISTYISASVDHELSGNIIDLCPVGALNNKPYRYRARAWEMTQHPLVSPHDCVGTNINGHVLRGRLMRVVPRRNEEINETWIADRDRFSCEGLYAGDRATRPMVNDGDGWRETDWEYALETAAAGLRQAVEQGGADQFGCLVSPGSTLEELYLAGRLTRGLGSENIDHRLRQQDVRDQENDPLAPMLGCGIADLETADGVLVVGSDLRQEVPMIAHRLRKATVRGASKLALINPRHRELLFPLAAELGDDGQPMAKHLAAVLVGALALRGASAPTALAGTITGIHPTEAHERVARLLVEGDLRLILIGALAQRSEAYSDLRALAAALAKVTGARLGFLPEGGNAVGAALAGATPHRGSGGRSVASPGLAAAEMLAAKLRAYLLIGGIEREDLSGSATLPSKDSFVVALTPYVGEQQLARATVILPIAAFAETSGTWVNVEGRWQSVPGAASPPGEARPAWKVLRVLGNLLGLAGFDYVRSDEIRDELLREIEEFPSPEPQGSEFEPDTLDVADPVVDFDMYAVDPVVRRSQPLQRTRIGRLEAGESA